MALALSSNTYAQADFDEIPNPETKEDERFQGTPYTEYGEFNEEEEENQSTLFFQYGRFFGVSLGFGLSGATGNRGLVYQGGFPTVDLRVHYWFDFNFALNLQLTNATFNYDNSSGGAGSSGTTDVNIFYLGLDLKYYFNTKDLSAALTFASPYLALGVGQFTKTEGAIDDPEPDTDQKIGFNVGAGLEFLLSPRTSFFYVEFKMQLVSFADRFSGDFETNFGAADLTGLFYTASAGIPADAV